VLLVTEAAALRSWWYPVAFVSDVSTGPRAQELLGDAIVVWRSADGVRVAKDRCPHRWAQLSRGRVLNDGTLECPYHGWRFQPEGKAAVIPQLGSGAALPQRACLDMLAVHEAYGLVWVCLETTARGGIPELPEWEAEGCRALPVGVIPYRCAAPVVIDNNLDAAHVAFVHQATFGARQDPRIDVASIQRTEFGLRQSSIVPVANRPGSADPTVRTSVTEIWQPFVQISRFLFPDGLAHILFKACCPRSDSTTDVFVTVIRNDTETDAAADEITDFERRVEDEDARVLATVPPEFPLDVTAQVHLRHDRASIELRRIYAHLLGN
jgi:phenylpropionate dioxygenase-like ring-hydroxylating dioxygenase large terminal subunit